jgi:alkaline phosphatase D
MAVHRSIAGISSVLLRIATYLSWRLAPGPLGLPAVSTLFAIYVPAFILSLRKPSTYVLIEDKIDVTLKEETLIEDVSDSEAPAGQVAPLLTKDVVVEETVTVVDAPPSLLNVLLTGAPHPSRLLPSLLSFLINLALILGSLDYVFRAHLHYPSEDLSFVRLGYVSHNEARFLLREPDQSLMPVTFEIHIKDPIRTTDNPLWQTAGGVNWTGNDTDFTAALTVPLRHAEQRVYEWKTSNGHSGEFLAPPKPGARPLFNNGKFTFLATSCILPRFPYNPLDHPLSIPGMKHLANLLPTLSAQFMLFMGDFIYIDVPQRMGVSAPDYRKKYRQVYASPEWAEVGRNLSWIHVFDDHEIANDWSSNTTGVYSSAIDPYVHYHVQVNPPPPKLATAKGTTQLQARYFEFTQGPATFFLLDTRTYRSPNQIPADNSDKTMLGPEQLEDLIQWLARPEPKGVKWKIIASSVPFTKNWPINRKDTWGGYMDERSRVLEAMWDAGARGFGVIILSGDRHEFAATKFPPPADGKWPATAVPYEFSASPLNQFASPIPTYKQTDNQDVMLRYIHAGQSKFGALTIEMLEDGNLSSLQYSLYVNGKEAWNTTILSPEATIVDEVKGSSFWSRLKF